MEEKITPHCEQRRLSNNNNNKNMTLNDSNHKNMYIRLTNAQKKCVIKKITLENYYYYVTLTKTTNAEHII